MQKRHYESFRSLFETCRDIQSAADILDGPFMFDLFYDYSFDDFMLMTNFESSEENVILYQTDGYELDSRLVVPFKLIGASNEEIMDYVKTQNRRMEEDLNKQKEHDYAYYKQRIAELEKEIDEIRKRHL